MLSYEKWSQDEHETFMRMVLAGKSRAKIARKLKRSVHSIQSRIYGYGLLKKIRKESSPPPRMMVAKHDVPYWYELGWIPIEFHGDHIDMEWGNDREPRWPADQQREAA